MLKSIKGVCRNGRVESAGTCAETGERPVIVTFLDSQLVDLTERGIDEKQAADLRNRLAAFNEDWNRPEMDVYDAL